MKFKETAGKRMSSGIDMNNSKGRAERWQVLPTVPQIDYIALLQHDEASLLIFVRPVEFDGHYLKIEFENALCYRAAQEGLFFNSIERIDRSLIGINFFTIAESAFLRQFHEYSSNAFDDWNITHYAVFTNFIVDVLSIEEPIVSWETKIPAGE